MNIFRAKQSEQGFSVVEALLVIVVLVAVIGIGAYVLHATQTNKKTTTTSSTDSTSAANSKKATVNSQSDNWQTAEDTTAGLQLQYPSNWKSTKSDDTAGGLVLGNDAVVVYEDPNPGNCTSVASTLGKFHVVSVNSLTDPGLSAKVIAGYSVDSLTNSDNNSVTYSYNPSFTVVTQQYVNKYKVEAGNTIEMPIAWTCYSYGVVNNSGNVFAQPLGNTSLSTEQDATAWFATNDAKDALKVLQSLTSN